MLSDLGAMQVLTTAESNKDLIRIDPLQRLHTLTNLSELLGLGVQGIARTLRDDQLQAQAEEIRQASARAFCYLCSIAERKCSSLIQFPSTFHATYPISFLSPKSTGKFQ